MSTATLALAMLAIRRISEGVKAGTIPWTGDKCDLDRLLDQYLAEAPAVEFNETSLEAEILGEG